jgi:hypothetical protein
MEQPRITWLSHGLYDIKKREQAWQEIEKKLKIVKRQKELSSTNS